MSHNPKVVIAKVEPGSTDLAGLIAKLDKELLERYPAEEVFGVDFNSPEVQSYYFVVAYSGDVPVGCGGLRPLDPATMELKRFFVDRDFRKQGIASLLLAHLEKHAIRSGYKAIKLETGTEQPESVQLYRKFGYFNIERYGEYACCESSICMEKDLRFSAELVETLQQLFRKCGETDLRLLRSMRGLYDENERLSREVSRLRSAVIAKASGGREGYDRLRDALRE